MCDLPQLNTYQNITGKTNNGVIFYICQTERFLSGRCVTNCWCFIRQVSSRHQSCGSLGRGSLLEIYPLLRDRWRLPIKNVRHLTTACNTFLQVSVCQIFANQVTNTNKKPQYMLNIKKTSMT